MEIREIKSHILLIPRAYKIMLLLLVDSFLCSFSLYVTLCMTAKHLLKVNENISYSMVFVSVTMVLILYALNIYRSINRHVSTETYKSIFNAGLILFCVEIVTFGIFDFLNTPKSISILHPIIVTFSLISFRSTISSFFVGFKKKEIDKSTKRLILIYGAGKWGRFLAGILQNDHSIKVIGFIDDDQTLQGNLIKGMKVFSLKEVRNIAISKKIDFVAFAINNISEEEKNKKIQFLGEADIAIQIPPDFEDWLSSENKNLTFTSISISESFGRFPAKPNNKIIGSFVAGKTILVTGAGGSIGEVLCEKLLKFNPTKILLLDISEYALFSINRKLNSHGDFSKTEIVPILGSVLDQYLLKRVFEKYSPSIIIHSAAYKHVDLVEDNIITAIANNVFGTYELANFASKYQVDKFILVSSDKAVNPKNIMGSTKRISEEIMLAQSNLSETKFCSVRFGNVFGSSGSVKNIFAEQIENGGPVTVTDPNVERYFMSIGEAANLILEAGAISEGNEIFILEMGPPIRIDDLARKMILLSGNSIKSSDNPAGDIEIVYTGLKPSEKLSEELYGNAEVETTSNRTILKIRQSKIISKTFEKKLAGLKTSLETGDENNIKKIMANFIKKHKQ